MFGGTRSVVTGLDIGSESIKAVRLAHSGETVKLLGVALVKIDYPSQSRGESDPGAHGARVDAIKSALRSSGTDTSKSCTVVTAVQGPNVSVKHLTFPKMPNPALAESIGWEAKKHVPFGSAEFILDFQRLERTDTDEADEMHVLLAAVERRYIDAHVGLVCEAGVEPDAVDLVPLALMNELDEQGLLDGETLAAVEIGASTLSMSMYRRGGLLLVRSVRMPVRAGATGGGGDGTESDDERREWQTFVLKEVQRSLAFYNSETRRRGIDKIYLCGGRALAPDIAGQFEQALSIGTEVLDPLAGVDTAGVDMSDAADQAPRLALAMSLARRS